MLDQRGRPPATRIRSLALPVPARAARALVLAAVFVCAACGLVYELELVALASYLVGDSVTQASLVLSVMVFAMGCGSLLAKRLRGRPAAAFVAVESALALVGGLSVMALYAVFAWSGHARPAMICCSFAIGVLIGAEVPLLMTLVQRIRRQDAGGAVADLFAADYVGALVGGLAFSFLLLPHLGQLTGALATGGVNAAAGGATVLWLFQRDFSRRARAWLLAANVGVLAVLACAAFGAGSFEQVARNAMYGGRVRVAEQSGAEEIVLTGGAGPGDGDGAPAGRDAPDAAPLRLYVDGALVVCGPDAAAYHQALVDPALAGPHHRVLLLGGGDGLALREVLRAPGVDSVTVVPGDPGVARLGRTDPGLTALNGHAFDDPRVRTAGGDVFDWLRGHVAGPRTRPARYDVILADLPDPARGDDAKLYAREFYGLAARALAPGGRLAMRTGPSVHSLWTTDATLRVAGLPAVPYVLSGGGACGRPRPTSWAFLLAGFTTPRLALPAPPLPGDSLTPQALDAAASRARYSRPRHPLPPSTLLRPRIVE